MAGAGLCDQQRPCERIVTEGPADRSGTDAPSGSSSTQNNHGGRPTGTAVWAEKAAIPKDASSSYHATTGREIRAAFARRRAQGIATSGILTITWVFVSSITNGEARMHHRGSRHRRLRSTMIADGNVETGRSAPR